jgi:hypothetical protein
MRIARRCSGRLSLLVAASIAASALPALAQVAAGEITGIVKDQAGAAVPGATVTVADVATNRQRIVTSGAEGVYTAPSLAPGDYRVDVELPGFKPVRRAGIRLSTGEKARIDFELAVGNVSEQVTVTADAPIVRAETASLGTVVEHDQVVQLPLNGRTFILLAGLAPGVALPPNSQLPRINGGRPRTNEYLFDGISVLQPEPGTVAFFPVIDAIQEFKIESNSPPAEFGRFNGGVINLTTKAGSNAFHGAGFEFLRNEGLNARNFFQSSNPVKPDYRRNQFGGTLGGPLVKDQTFFFVDYQGQRQAIGRTVTSTIPTLRQRQGIFTEAIGGRVPAIYDPFTTAGSTRTQFAGGAIPAARMDPVALALLQRYPLPTAAGVANNFSRTDDEIDNQDQWDARIDHRFASNHDQVFGRLSFFRDGFVPVTPLPDGSGLASGVIGGPQDTSAWSFASNYQHSFSSNLLNEVRAGETRRTAGRTAAQLASTAGGALSIPGIPSNAQFPNTLPAFLVGGYQQLGSPVNTASDFNTSVTEVADSLTWLKGRHTFKIGLDWRWERLNVIQPPSPTGSFTFSAVGSDLPGTLNTGTPLASFLLGQVQSFSIDLQQSAFQDRAHFQEYFIQDDWKVSDRFTLNPGLRYTLNFPSTEIKGQTAVFNLQTQLLEYPGANPVRPLKKNNFGPRMGGVYRLTGQTILSAGYGLIWIEMAGITTPFTTPTFPFLQTVSQRALDTINPAFLLRNGPSVAPIPQTATAGLGQGVFAVDSTLGSGYVQQWNMSLQRELTTNTTFEASYAGSFITHVGIPDTNINQLSVGQLALGASLNAPVANPYFGIVPRASTLGNPTIAVAQLLKPFPAYTTVSLYRNNVGTTRYAGLALSIRQRLAHGLLFTAAYTRSKLIDDASSVFDPFAAGAVATSPVADSFNRALERDYSTGDIPHNFVSSIVWELPFGAGRAHPLHGVAGAILNDWTVTALITMQSGVPVAVTQTTNFNAFAGFGVQRPNMVADPTLPADQRTPSQWFNTAAFAIAPVFTIGNATRNPVTGPSYRNVDFALIRRVPIRGGTAIEVRAEVFNLLNTPNLGAPNGVAGSAAFGTITSALDPRVGQLAVKVLF